jgi:hypothetical protein
VPVSQQLSEESITQLIYRVKSGHGAARGRAERAVKFLGDLGESVGCRSGITFPYHFYKQHCRTDFHTTRVLFAKMLKPIPFL